jgi:PKHD-type hydroxylase
MEQPQFQIYNINNVIVVPNALPDSKIVALQQYQKRFGQEPDVGTVAGGEVYDKIGRDVDIIRSCKTSWINSDSKFNSELVNMVTGLIQTVALQNYGFDFHRCEPLQYTHYTYIEENDIKDHYDWHIDSHLMARPTPFDRKVSVSIQLSDSNDYTGCDLTFPGWDTMFDSAENIDDSVGQSFVDGSVIKSSEAKEILRQKGTAIFFPSMFAHRVTPIESGERFALVCWLQGPKYR